MNMTFSFFLLFVFLYITQVVLTSFLSNDIIMKKLFLNFVLSLPKSVISILFNYTHIYYSCEMSFKIQLYNTDKYGNFTLVHLTLSHLKAHRKAVSVCVISTKLSPINVCYTMGRVSKIKLWCYFVISGLFTFGKVHYWTKHIIDALLRLHIYDNFPCSSYWKETRNSFAMEWSCWMLSNNPSHRHFAWILQTKRNYNVGGVS